MNTDTAEALQRLLHADVASLQQEDGSFAGDQWGEIDTRQIQLCMCLSWLHLLSLTHTYITYTIITITRTFGHRQFTTTTADK